MLMTTMYRSCNEKARTRRAFGVGEDVLDVEHEVTSRPSMKFTMNALDLSNSYPVLYPVNSSILRYMTAVTRPTVAVKLHLVPSYRLWLMRFQAQSCLRIDTPCRIPPRHEADRQ